MKQIVNPSLFCVGLVASLCFSGCGSGEPVCGDGSKETAEECDDGNSFSGDGCDATCLQELCGNGRIEGLEECDDNNQVEADGCEADCSLPACSNGIVDPDELCYLDSSESPIINGSGVVLGDFDSDGQLDIATIDGSDFVGVTLGNGDGTFQSPQISTVGSVDNPLVVGDFDSDGQLDLITSGQLDFVTNGVKVNVLLGNGDGTFQFPISFPVDNLVAALVVGDFDSDGQLDLATNGPGGASVNVLLGNGDGTLQSPNTFPAGDILLGGLPLAVGDLNSDGLLDLAVANTVTNQVSVLFGNGDGTLQSPNTFPAGSVPTSAAVGDVDGNGLLDLVVTSLNAQTASVLLGNGDGTFQEVITSSAGRSADTLALVDLDLDGILDLAIVQPFLNFDSNDSNLLLMSGNGDGTFQSPLVLSTAPFASALGVGDLNGDSLPDLATDSFTDDKVTLFFSAP